MVSVPGYSTQWAYVNPLTPSVSVTIFDQPEAFSQIDVLSKATLCEPKVGGWNVRWSDADEYGTYARIQKEYWLDNYRNKTDIAISIQQDIDNLISVSLFYTKPAVSAECSVDEKYKETVATINDQSIRMKTRINDHRNCDTSFTWIPISSSGKEFLRSEFNSGVVRFSYDFVDHIFDTRDHIPAYKLMKKIAITENEKAKNAL